MASVDPKVRQALARANASATVIVTTSGGSAAVKGRLEAEGIAVRSEIAELGVVVARIAAPDLDVLTGITGVESVELDEQASAL